MTRKQMIETLQTAHPTATIIHGYRFAGAGPASKGWWAQYPSGYTVWLGRTLAAAIG